MGRNRKGEARLVGEVFEEEHCAARVVVGYVRERAIAKLP